MWNGWSLWLFARHETGLLPGGPTMSLIEEGPYRLSRNPLYVGLLVLHLAIAVLVPSFWAVVALPVSWVLVWWGAVRPEERFLHERFGAPYDAYTRRVRRWLRGGPLPVPGACRFPRVPGETGASPPKLRG